MKCVVLLCFVLFCSVVSPLVVLAPFPARVIVFVIGGACYSEIRSAYEAMHKYGREVSTINTITSQYY